ncbi:L,D-transpeptidase family protein [Filomicrobium sp.]|uniref:L,D-transpeptidase family protein n=1 Tax=Filomicrobium sp. TaxID=2024831 RepID=UPI00258F1037|nr:L,D-transpeptidase family protein [Filomicrobium sp.]MCV0368866.1 L,D-transpeptidase family protein [Filomicrobium sp.]
MTGMGSPTRRNWKPRGLLLGLTLALLAGIAPITDATAKKRSNTPQSSAEEVSGPLTIVVSLRRQRLHIFDANGLVSSAPISSGRAGYRTPKGIFTILQKRRRHYSNLYGGAPMPNMQRLTWSGIALHAGPLPGYPASHGCIRLPSSFSRYLFGLTNLGGRVIVTDEPVAPVRIAHPALLKPLPPGNPPATVQTASLVQTAGPGATPHSTDLLLGVTAANAAETLGSEKRTRASVAAARAQELIDLEATLTRCRNEEQEIGAELTSANLALRSAIEAVKTAEVELGNVHGLIDATASAKSKTADEMLAFMTKNAQVEGEEAIAKAMAEEDTLETKMLEQIATYELALSDEKNLRRLIGDRRLAAGQAKDHRDGILRRHIAARKAAVAASAALDKAKKADARRDKPISILLSRKASKMYVRQGYDDIFEAAIEFQHPDAPVGTHVFTALAYTEDGADLEWHAVTATTRSVSRKSSKTKGEVIQTANLPKQTPGNAIERVNIPQEIRDQLAEHLKPGSSIIITDEGRSYETGKYTDLIVEFR